VAAYSFNGGRSEAVSVCCSAEGHLYTDVFPDDWYYECMEYCVTNGILSGLGGGRMAPASPLTRGMIVTMLHRIAGKPAQESSARFSDVDGGAWYFEAASWAQGEGITNGYPDGSFGPDRNISRQDLACMAYRYFTAGQEPQDAGMLRTGEDTAGGGSGEDVPEALAGFPDAGSVAGYALKAVGWAVENDLLVTPDGKLAPARSATRAETAELMMRFELMQKSGY
jgi:hypothetical protein